MLGLCVVEISQLVAPLVLALMSLCAVEYQTPQSYRINWSHYDCNSENTGKEVLQNQSKTYFWLRSSGSAIQLVNILTCFIPGGGHNSGHVSTF